MAKFPTPKKPRPDRLTNRPDRLTDATRPSGGGHNIQIEHSDVEHSEVISDESRVLTEALHFSTAIQQAEKRNRRRRRAKADRGAKRTLPKMAEANAIWIEEFEEVFGYPPEDRFTIKLWGQFKRNTKQSPIPDFRKYIADVCNNWESLVSGPLEWADRLEHFPTVTSVVVLVRHIRIALKKTSVDIRKQEEKFSGAVTTEAEEYADGGEFITSVPLPVGSQTGRMGGFGQAQNAIREAANAMQRFGDIASSLTRDEYLDAPQHIRNDWLRWGGDHSEHITGETILVNGEYFVFHSPRWLEPIRNGQIDFSAEITGSTPVEPEGRQVIFDMEAVNPQNISVGDYQLRDIGMAFELYVYLGRRRGWENTHITIQRHEVDSRSKVELVAYIEELET